MSNIEEAKKFKDLGNVAFQAQNFEEALQHFTKAIELNPNDHVFYSNRSGCHASLKNYEKALEDAEKCISLKPDWGKGYQRKGFAEFYLDQYDKAIETYTKGLQTDPNNQQLKEGLERALEKKKGGGSPQMDDFTKQLLAKLVTNPETKGFLNDPDFVQKLMMIQQNPQNMGMFANDPKIQKAFQVMFEDMGMGKGGKGPFGGDEGQEGPGHEGHEGHSHEGHEGHSHEGHEGHSHEGHEGHDHGHEGHEHQSHEGHNQYEEYKHEQSKSKESAAEQEKNKGNEEYKKKNFEEALKHYDKAIELEPTDVLFYNNKAACFIEQNELLKALEICDKALEIASEHSVKDFLKIAKLYSRKASIFTKMENYEQAIFFYEKSLLENQDPKVKDELRRIQKVKKDHDELQYIDPSKAEELNNTAKELFQQGRFPEALKEYEESIKRNPKDPKLYSNKAACLQKLLDFPGALKSIDKCLELDPNFIKAYGKKGNIHYSMKEYHRALEAFEKGLKFDPENVECKEGIVKVNSNIMNSREDKDVSDERARHAMADPEIQAILKNPNIMAILRNMQENPNNPENMKAMRDPGVAAAIQKLIASGVLKMG